MPTAQPAMLGNDPPRQTLEHPFPGAWAIRLVMNIFAPPLPHRGHVARKKIRVKQDGFPAYLAQSHSQIEEAFPVASLRGMGRASGNN
jgi:hypothetical protein